MYANYHMLAQISLLPHFKDDSERTNLLQQLEWASKSPSDILRSSGKGSTEAEIKKALGG